MAWTTVGAVHGQAVAVMDKVARMVLPLLLRGIGLRSDALSSVLDDTHMPLATASSSELHVIRYRGPLDGEEELLSLTVPSHGRVANSGNRLGTTQAPPITCCYVHAQQMWVMRQLSGLEQACSIICKYGAAGSPHPD